jgi:CheY-like chemotaxis protein
MDTELRSFDGLRVLVIDIATDASESTALLLRLDGHHVQVTNCGSAALQIAATYEPDVVFLDLALPEMDGYTVAKTLRDRKASMWPFLIGHGTIEEQQRSADAGIHMHLVKPVNPHMLAVILEWLEWKRCATRTQLAPGPRERLWAHSAPGREQDRVLNLANCGIA